MSAEEVSQVIQRVFPNDVSRNFLRRPSIPLTELRIGFNFRNRQELEDVRDSLDLVPGDHLIHGLVGSRTQGRFFYTPKQLLDALWHNYQVPDHIRQQLLRKQQVNQSYYKDITQIADFLKHQVSSVDNLDDIDLSKLPPEAAELVEMNRYYYLRSWNETNPRNIRKEGDKYLRPASLVPDIDIAYITLSKEPHPRWKMLVGERSGTAINLIEIYPNSYNPRAQYEDEIVSARLMAKQFIPFN